MIDYDDFEFASSTDVGIRRSHNQDSYALLPASDGAQFRQRGHVVLVADGMGAHAVGELASKLAADGIPHIYSKHAQEGPNPALRRAFVEVNQNIHTRGQANPEFHGMGTTGTALVLRPEGAWIGHVGDSRLYRVRGGVLDQLSFDHSLVWELARRQRRNPDELPGVPSNVIVRSLGPEPTVAVDVEGPHPLEPGDVFVLCSDGLSGPVNDREIGAVAAGLPPEEACRFLVHLANLQGGPDNITVLIARVRGAAAPSVDRPAVATAPWSGNPLVGQTREWLAGVPWSFVALILGILLAVAAVFLSAANRPGDLAAFVAAGGLLVFGLFGLVWQSLRDRKGHGQTGKRKLHVYRQIPCAIDASIVERLDRAMQTLLERAAENQWTYDLAAVAGFEDRAKAAAQKGEWLEAFREKCRAMMIVMDAVQLNRSKEESFRPIWDKSTG